MMPLGRLREKQSGSKRASIIVVTKCPDDIRPIDMRLIETELAIEHKQSLFFSSYRYQEIIPVFPKLATKKRTCLSIKKNNTAILIVAGIVSPQAIVSHLQNYTDKITSLFFPDHHRFKQKDFNQIIKKLDAIDGADKILLVTEKDAARLISNPLFPEKLKAKTYALPIKVEILQNDEALFTQKIIDYVVENSRNC
jgi:tetraacyldisaccharide 4'-kinase